MTEDRDCAHYFSFVVAITAQKLDGLSYDHT